jgi:hypothetical protein
MGLITAALGGAGEGLEKGSNLAGGLYLKSTLEADRERLAEEAKSQREERNLRLASSLKREEEAAQPRIIPAGSTVQRQGQPDFQAPAAPEKALTPEQIDKLKAEAEELRARSRYYNRDQGKTPKETMPKLIATEKDDQGNPIQWLDQNTGAIGNRVSGSPAVPPVSHWFSANEPGKAAIPSGINWTDASGQPLPGLHVYYPDMMNRGVGEGAPGAPAAPKALPDPLGLRAGFQQPGAPKATLPGDRIVPTPTPTAKPLTVEPYLGVARGGYQFSAPNRAGIATQLNGRFFKTKQDAQAAYDALINQAE